jgi:putative NADPH-quinone reductase
MLSLLITKKNPKSFENKYLRLFSGGASSTSFAKMVSGTFEGDVAKTRHALLAYCKLDTLAMVEIYRVLKAL